MRSIQEVCKPWLMSLASILIRTLPNKTCIEKSIQFKNTAIKNVFQMQQRRCMNCSRAAAEFGSSAPSGAISPDTEKVQLIVIHMRVFDWPILMENVARYGLEMPKNPECIL